MFNIFWLIYMILAFVCGALGWEVWQVGMFIIAVIYNCTQIIIEEIRKCHKR